MEKMGRREARAMGDERQAERALGNRLGSEQKRPSFGYLSLARKKSSPGVRGRSAPLGHSGGSAPCPVCVVQEKVRGRSAPPIVLK
jgi:hypothetical protein